jgi:hypothetical protein
MVRFGAALLNSKLLQQFPRFERTQHKNRIYTLGSKPTLAAFYLNACFAYLALPSLRLLVDLSQ